MPPVGNWVHLLNCHTGSEPEVWTADALPTNFLELHLEQSPETPYAIPEFQGGAIAYWGGSWDLEQCAAFIGPEAERVFYKNNFGFGIDIFNIYMVCHQSFSCTRVLDAG